MGDPTKRMLKWGKGITEQKDQYCSSNMVKARVMTCRCSSEHQKSKEVNLIEK